MPIPLKLSVYRGSELVSEEQFDRDIVKIGRLASAHLRLDDEKVSRIHAVIESSGDGHEYAIIDMGSTEGTYVNGQKISKHRLMNGDELVVGESRIVVQISGAPASDVAMPTLQSGPPMPVTPPEQLWAASPQEMSHVPPTMDVGQALPRQASVMPAPSVAPIPSAVPMGQPPMGYAPQQTMPPVQYAGGYAPQQTMPPGTPMPMPPMPMAQQPMPQHSGYVAPGTIGAPVQQPAWGSVPNNLASNGVSDRDRALEIKALWGGTSVLETVNAFDEPNVTIGDERNISGWGPFQKVIRCDIEVPSKGLPIPTFPLAESMGAETCNYVINVPGGLTGRLERANGTMLSMEQLYQGGPNIEAGEYNGSVRYILQPEETLYLVHGAIVFQIRYVRRTNVVPIPMMERLNFAWLNMLVLAFFIHAMAIVSFEATPVTEAVLTEDIFKNRNRFAQFLLKPEEQRKQKSTLLSKLKEGEPGAKHRGKEGKAGRKDYKGKKQGRMAVKGDPNEKEIAKSALNKLFGKGKGGRSSFIFGTGGLGGELKSALGGVTGAEIGDATGLGGLGVRGTGPGGGGLSSDSVGLGALGTRGRGGGQGGYGDGVGGIGRKADRDINISAGSPVIMGSLDKEIIRRVIKQHLAQIRYCYEKELVRNPGLFGKVKTNFVISAAGTVQSAKVDQTTLKNKEVERCITAKIRTWRFPKPKGGGIVVVKYPFLFKTSG